MGSGLATWDGLGFGAWELRFKENKNSPSAASQSAPSGATPSEYTPSKPPGFPVRDPVRGFPQLPRQGGCVTFFRIYNGQNARPSLDNPKPDQGHKLGGSLGQSTEPGLKPKTINHTANPNRPEWLAHIRLWPKPSSFRYSQNVPKSSLHLPKSSKLRQHVSTCSRSREAPPPPPSFWGHAVLVHPAHFAATVTTAPVPAVAAAQGSARGSLSWL